MLKELNATNSTYLRALEEVDTEASQSTGKVVNQEEEKGKNKQEDLIKNLGVIIVLVMAILLALLVLLIMRQMVYYKYSWFKYYANLKRQIFYNTFIRFFLQGALKMQIAFCLTLMTDGWTHWRGDKVIT